MNFLKKASISVGAGGKKAGLGKDIDLKGIFKFNLREKMDRTERNLFRAFMGVVVAIVVYACFVEFVIMRQISEVSQEVQAVIGETQTELALVTSDELAVTERTRHYNEVVTRLNERREENNTQLAMRNAIPNLLNRVMFAIPQEVQLLNISNDVGSEGRIKIEAKARSYHHLGLFIAVLRNDEILINVTSTAGRREGIYIKVEIEGYLPGSV